MVSYACSDTEENKVKHNENKENPIPVLFAQNFYLLESKSAMAI